MKLNAFSDFRLTEEEFVESDILSEVTYHELHHNKTCLVHM